MRLFTLALLTLLVATNAAAVDITIQDPYGGNPPNPWNKEGGSGDDVVGLLRSFDIDYVKFTVITAQEVQALIHVNYNPDGNGDPRVLNQWCWDGCGGDHPRYLNSGDLLFDVGTTYKYAVPIVAHDSLLGGALYAITNQVDVKTSTQVFGSGGGQDIPVWFRPSGTPTKLGDRINDTPTWVRDTTDSLHNPNAAGIITLRFTPTTGFLADLANTGLSVHYASATCANDYLDGSFQYAIPEPMSMVLMGGGLLALGLFGRRHLLRRG